MKLDLFSECLHKDVFESFLTHTDNLTVSGDDLSQEIINPIIWPLQGLNNSLRDYFPLHSARNNEIKDRGSIC